jgi:hypothetical protein
MGAVAIGLYIRAAYQLAFRVHDSAAQLDFPYR